jgi:hypothetical protein
MNEILAELIAKGIDMDALGDRGRHMGVPMELLHLMHGALEHDRAKRYQSVREMLERIRRIQDGQVLVSCHVTAFKRFAYESIHWVDRHPLTYTFILFFLFLSTVTGLGVGAYQLVRGF